MEAVDEQSPPAVAVAEILGAFHCGHVIRRQPVAACIKKHGCGILVVDAFKETHAADKLLTGICDLFAVKGRHPADGFSGGITEKPPDGITVAEKVVNRGVEDRLNIPEEWFYPVPVAFVDKRGKIMKFPDLLFAFYLSKLKIAGHLP